MNIEEIIPNTGEFEAEAAIEQLKVRSINVPQWAELEKEYDPKHHPVMDETKYADIVDSGEVEYVTRIPLDYQRLAASRITELCFGVPVKRVYKAETDTQKKAAAIIEAILQRNRINAVNIERGNRLFSCCEFATVWYGIEENNGLYGVDSKLKLRCATFSPRDGAELYPLLDEYGDMVAFSIATTIKMGEKEVVYFDTYTSYRHIKWKNADGAWEVVEDKPNALLKIPVIYSHRASPIWENASNLVYESEWALSRNGNYLRRNSKPIFAVFADEEIEIGNEDAKDNASRTVLQYPKGGSAGYITWAQAVENLKYYVQELKQAFFTSLQIPDLSYENLKSNPMSGEAMKQMLIDANLKVMDESGRLIEFLDRELNVIKEFVKVIMGESAKNDIDALSIETIITPYTITDEKDTIANLTTATGGKAIISQKEAIEALGWSNNADETLRQIKEEENAGELSL
ncbi:MAG: phage portal protein [Bacteroidales bacterium]